MTEIELRKASKLDVEQALELAMEEYRVEAKYCKTLNDMGKEENEIQVRFKELIEELFQQKYAYVAYYKNQLVGYIAFWGPIEGFFGNVKGAWSPIGGNAFTHNEIDDESDRAKLSSRILSYAMEEMVQDEVASFALSRYAHDEEVAKTLVLNGYGIRCSDAIQVITNSSAKCIVPENIVFEELKKEDFQHIIELDKGLCKHLQAAPICYPTYLEEAYPNKKVRTNSRIFVAKDAKKKDQIIGYFRVGDDGETIYSELESVKNICGTFVKPEYRNHNIAEGLLYYVEEVLRKEGVTYLGVDCETLNPTALRFWRKYFKNYTYSFARRIDERVIGYDKYWNEFWRE